MCANLGKLHMLLKNILIDDCMHVLYTECILYQYPGRTIMKVPGYQFFSIIVQKIAHQPHIQNSLSKIF